LKIKRHAAFFGKDTVQTSKESARFANQQCLVVSVAQNSFKSAKSIQALHFNAKKA